MKIVILDGYQVNDGDLSWDGLLPFGALAVYDRTPKELVAERVGNAEIVFTNKVFFTKEVFAACKNLKFIGVLATGFDNIDIVEAAARGVTVCNVPGYSTLSVAQMTFALLLEIVCKTALHSESVLKGGWVKAPDYSYRMAPVTELAGKTIGLVGYGKIGAAVGKIAEAFGMRVIFYSPTKKGATPLNELLARSDVVSLHCPLTAVNRGMLDKTAFSKIKRGAILINTARGGLVDDQALADALNDGTLSAAGLDVVSVEPMRVGNPLLTAANVIITPHIAWASREARSRLIDISVANLAAYLKGKPQNKINCGVDNPQ
ncbi:MAG: D-2-hydroxyacid dehydrogenase [Clostridiaceae bacterium]|jgi:glycerate dehydrogenase|nr:D-2-hydroxyacid dehydrogenase [Clostridiaceae bacterium]